MSGNATDRIHRDIRAAPGLPRGLCYRIDSEESYHLHDGESIDDSSVGDESHAVSIHSAQLRESAGLTTQCERRF